MVKWIRNTAAPSLIYHKRSGRRLDAQSEMPLYRMVQESLNNVIHHANAKHTWVELNFTDQDCAIHIRDDGKGLIVPGDPAEFPKQGHFGLLGLQERSELIHAELTIDSNPGDGTTSHTWLSSPVRQETA